MKKEESTPLQSQYSNRDMRLLRPTDYRQPFDDNQPMDNEPGSLLWWEQVVETSKLQEIQDRFAKIMRIGSIITTVDGDPITRPSHFSDFLPRNAHPSGK